MISDLDDVRGQRQGRPLVEGQVRHLQGYTKQMIVSDDRY